MNLVPFRISTDCTFVPMGRNNGMLYVYTPGTEPVNPNDPEAREKILTVSKKALRYLMMEGHLSETPPPQIGIVIKPKGTELV